MSFRHKIFRAKHLAFVLDNRKANIAGSFVLFSFKKIGYLPFCNMWLQVCAELDLRWTGYMKRSRAVHRCRNEARVTVKIFQPYFRGPRGSPELTFQVQPLTFNIR